MPSSSEQWGHPSMGGPTGVPLWSEQDLRDAWAQHPAPHQSLEALLDVLKRPNPHPYGTLHDAAHWCVSWFEELWNERCFSNEAQEQKMLKEAQEYTAAPSLDEAADVFITLIGCVAKQGWTVDLFSEAVQDKMVVNEQRQWAQLPDGTYQHRG